MPCHNQPHGAKHPATFPRIRRGFRDRRHLVAAIAFPILFESLLRSLVAKFLPLRRGLSRHRPLCSISISARTEDRHAGRRPLLDSVSAKCCPPNHSGRRSVLHGTRRLRHLRADIGNLVEDRKSTRLNSSHVAISYAVFCLKKKNNEQIIRTPTSNLC